MNEVLVERRGDVVWLTFNRPDARNAMTFAMYERMAEVAGEVDADRGVRALVLTGAGGAFVAGTDISQFSGFTRNEDALEYEARMDAWMSALERVRVPTIAALRGARVKEIVFTARLVDAEEALRIGLYNEVTKRRGRTCPARRRARAVDRIACTAHASGNEGGATADPRSHASRGERRPHPSLLHEPRLPRGCASVHGEAEARLEGRVIGTL